MHHRKEDEEEQRTMFQAYYDSQQEVQLKAFDAAKKCSGAGGCDDWYFQYQTHACAHLRACIPLSLAKNSLVHVFEQGSEELG